MDTAYRLLAQGFDYADHLVPRSLGARVDAQRLIDTAGVAPDSDARAGLRELLSAIEAESELTLFGRLSLRWDMKRLLRNAALINEWHSKNPTLSQAPISEPIFILGLPRSGTTFLHALLAADPANQAPRNWQTIFPAPRPADFDPSRDKRVRIVDQQLKMFNHFAPGFDVMHPVTADSPQECSEITSHVFQSLRFDTIFRIPSYMLWLERQGHEAAFAFHKKFLQFLQNGVPSRWVLKCPDHTFSLDAIIKTYPDARFIIVHRNPLSVLGSVANLTQVLRKPFLRNSNPAEIGRQVSERWTHGADILLAFDQRQDIPDWRKLHLHYQDVTSAPLRAINRIYDHFGISLSDAALKKLPLKIKAEPFGGYAAHPPYPLEAFRINKAAVQRRMAPYIDQFCRDI